MCDPITVGMAALRGIQTVAQIGSQNAAHSANAQNAIQAGNEESTSSTAQFIEQNRSLIQGGFDAELEGRENEALAYASALENGVQGASVKALVRGKRVVAGRNSGRAEDEIQSLGTQAGANLRHINTQTKSRINSVPATSFGIGDVAGILAPIVKTQTE